MDHIVSRKHGGISTTRNLAYACILCNRYKGTDLGSIIRPSDQIVALFNPRLQKWSDHFRLECPVIQPITLEGEVTLKYCVSTRQNGLSSAKYYSSCAVTRG
ncbi:MAG: HNH endonuclease [Bryobacteraceae bacterium]